MVNVQYNSEERATITANMEMYAISAANMVNAQLVLSELVTFHETLPRNVIIIFDKD